MLGEKIQRLRKEKGMSQEQLAAQLTISRQAVSKWELGESMPDTENIIQLSKLFSVSTDFLLNDECTDKSPSDSLPPIIEVDDLNSKRQETGIQTPASSTRKTIGFILLGAGLIALILMLVFSDYLVALIIGMPLIISGIICLTVKKHTALWCCWTMYILFYLIYSYVTGGGLLWIFRIGSFNPNSITPRTILTYIVILVLIALISVTAWTIQKSKRIK